MIPAWPSRSSGLTCDTTSGTVGSIRQAAELSMTVAPWATAAGVRSRDTSPPAENRAMSTPSNADGTASPISSERPSRRTLCPADRPEARRRSSPTGKSRSLRTWIIVRPTTPVAPTTATVRECRFMRGVAPLARSLGRARPEYSSGCRASSREAWRGRRDGRSRRLPGGSARSRRRLGRTLCRILGEVALHGRLAGQVDPALAVDLGHHHHHLVADGHDVLDGRHVVVGELADPDEALLAGQDLDERAEAHDPGDLAQVEGPDLDLAGQALDPLDRLARVLAADRGDLHGAVVLDVDLGLGLLLDLADHRPTLADHLADLLGVDLDGDDARGVVAHLG